MILDDSLITLRDGEHQKAMEVYPGKEVLSFKCGKSGRATVHAKVVGMQNSTVRLLFASGGSLTGSWDQPVAKVHAKNVRYIPMNEVGIGDKLLGERAGMPVTLDVIGRTLPGGEARLVGFDTGGFSFVAEGVLVR